MRDAFGKVDGQHNHVLPFTDRPLVLEEPHRRRGRPLRLRDLCRAPHPESLALPGGHRAGLPRPLGGLQGTDPGRPRLRRPSPRVPRPQRVDEPRPRRLDRLRRQQRGAPTTTTTRLLGADATLPLAAAAPLHLHPPPRPRRGRLEPPGGARGDRRRLRRLRLPRVPVRAPLVRRPALRQLGPGRRPRRSRDKGGSFLLTYWPSEFSQVRGQYRHTRFGERQHGQRVPLPVPLLHRRPRRPPF